MPTNLRRLGVYGQNLPTKRTLTVVPSDFLIGGLIGRFERSYNKAFLVRSIDEFREIFGQHVVSTFYGSDAVKGFWDNVVGVDAKLYVAAYVGNSAGSIDAVVGSRSVNDAGAAASLKAEAGFEEELEYGAGGNRTGTQLTLTTRFDTQAAAVVAPTGVSSATLDSVIGFKVGDIVRFIATAGTPGTVYKVLTAVDETAKTVTWTGDFESAPAAAEQLDVDDVVNIPGFTLQTFRKDINGVETEVDIELGKVVCTMESVVTDFYAPNVFASSKWLVVTDLASASTLGDRLFATDTNPVYLTSGADGTAPTVAADWANSLNLFDALPVRFLANPESTVAAIQSAGEAYAFARDDNPKWIFTIAEDRTKAQLITIGNNLQRSNEVDGVICANWLKVSDPFATSSIAPARTVPNVGHVMGSWVRAVGIYGVHFVPAIKQNPMFGVVGVTGAELLDDADRTDVAEAGINMIQDLDGIGVTIRNFFTPSTDLAFQFANGILMRDFIKVSAVDSLSLSENTPNSINRIREDKMAILQFLYRLWANGSTGNVAEGESFGRTQDVDGSESVPETHFEVKADLVNNPQSSINAGQRNLDVFFTYPSPAGSIKIGVGILLLS